MTDLDAIRARHTDSIGPQWDENGNVIGNWCNECDAKWPCDASIAFAEVDRLTEEKTAIINKWQSAERDVLALRARVLPTTIADPGLAIERARIHAAVGELAKEQPDDKQKSDPWWDGWHEALDAVLRAIEGEPT